MAEKLPLDPRAQFVSGLTQLAMEGNFNEASISELRKRVNISDSTANYLVTNFATGFLNGQKEIAESALPKVRVPNGIEASLNLACVVEALKIDKATIPDFLDSIKPYVDSLSKDDEASLAISFGKDFKNPRVEPGKIEDGVWVASYDYAPNKKCRVFIRLSLEDMKKYAELKYTKDPKAGVGSYKVAYSPNKKLPIIEVEFNFLFERVCAENNIDDQTKRAILVNVGGAVRLCDGIGKSDYYPYIGRDLGSCRAIKHPNSRFIPMGYCIIGSKRVPFFLEVSDADLQRYSFMSEASADAVDRSDEEILDMMSMDFQNSKQKMRLEAAYNLDFNPIQKAVGPQIVDIISQKKLDVERGLFVSKDGSFCSRNPREGFYVHATYITFIGQIFQIFIEISDGDVRKIQSTNELVIDNLFQFGLNPEGGMDFTRHYKKNGKWNVLSASYGDLKMTNTALCIQRSLPVTSDESTSAAPANGEEGSINASERSISEVVAEYREFLAKHIKDEKIVWSPRFELICNEFGHDEHKKKAFWSAATKFVQLSGTEGRDALFVGLDLNGLSWAEPGDDCINTYLGAILHNKKYIIVFFRAPEKVHKERISPLLREQSNSMNALEDILNQARSESVLRSGPSGLNSVKNVEFFQFGTFKQYCQNYGISVDNQVTMAFEAVGKAHQMRTEAIKGALLFSKDFTRIERMVEIPEIAVPVMKIRVLDDKGKAKEVIAYKESDIDEVNRCQEALANKESDVNEAEGANEAAPNKESDVEDISQIQRKYLVKDELQRNYTTFDLTLIANIYCDQTERDLVDINSRIQAGLMDRIKEEDPSRCLIISEDGKKIISEKEVTDGKYLVVIGNVFLEGKGFAVVAELSKENCDSILDKDKAGVVLTYNQFKDGKFLVLQAGSGETGLERTVEEYKEEAQMVHQLYEGYLYNKLGVSPGLFSFQKRAGRHFKAVRKQAIGILNEWYKEKKLVSLEGVKFEELFENRGYTKELMAQFKEQYNKQIEQCAIKLAQDGSIPETFLEETLEDALKIYEENKDADPALIGELMSQCYTGYEFRENFDDIKDALTARGVSDSDLNEMSEGFYGELYFKYVSLENDELLGFTERMEEIMEVCDGAALATGISEEDLEKRKKIFTDEKSRTPDGLAEYLRTVLFDFSERYSGISKSFFLRLALTQYQSSGLLKESDKDKVFAALQELETEMPTDAEQKAHINRGMQEFQLGHSGSHKRVINIGSEPKQTGVSEEEKARLQKILEARMKKRKKAKAPVVNLGMIKEAAINALQLEEAEEKRKAAEFEKEMIRAKKRAERQRVSHELKAMRSEDKLAHELREAENKAILKEQKRLLKLKRKQEAEKKEAEAKAAALEAAAKAKIEAEAAKNAATEKREIKAKLKKAVKWLKKEEVERAKTAFDGASNLIKDAKYASKAELSNYQEALNKLKPQVDKLVSESTGSASKEEPVVEETKAEIVEESLNVKKSAERASNGAESLVAQVGKANEFVPASAAKATSTADRHSESDPEEQGKVTPRNRSTSPTSQSNDQEIELTPEQLAKMKELDRYNDVSKRKVDLQRLGLDDQQIAFSAHDYVQARFGLRIEEELKQTVETYKNLNVPDDVIGKFCRLVRSQCQSSVESYGYGQPVPAYGYHQQMVAPAGYGYQYPPQPHPYGMHPQFYPNGQPHFGPAPAVVYAPMMHPGQPVQAYPNGGTSNYSTPQAPNPSNQNSGEIPQSLVVLAGGNMQLAALLLEAFQTKDKKKYHSIVNANILDNSVKSLAMSYFNRSNRRRKKNK